MIYEEVIDQIIRRRRFGKASGDQVTREMMEHLCHPENGMRMIHIAGTNGKGSTAAFVSSILQAAGFCVGQFTSPHLIDFSERIQVNGQKISHADAARLGEQVLCVPMRLECTMFDLALAMAILYFREKNCDFVVLETGLGGRLDSTNGLSVVPLVSVITNIGLEHTQVLGNTIEKIAAEKAGILKAGTCAVLGKMDASAHEILKERCKAQQIPWTDAGEWMPADQEGAEKLGLFGAYQRQNAATAAAVFETAVKRCPALFRGMDTTAALKHGLADAVWPGRMELLSQKPFLMVDGAHNPQGVHALAQSLREAYPEEKFRFVVGILADKDYGAMLEEMFPLAKDFVTVTVDSSRSLQGAAVAKYLRACGQKAEFESDLGAFLHDISQMKDLNQKIIVFGSLYFVGSVKALWESVNDLDADYRCVQ